MIALRRAAQRGRLDAVQGADGIWRSSRKAVNVYRASRHQRWSNSAPSEQKASKTEQQSAPHEAGQVRYVRGITRPDS